MAAAYQTGAPTSPTILLQTLVTWLVAQGWTQNMSQADGTGWRAHLSKGGNYINFRASPGSEAIWSQGISGTLQPGIALYMGTGYSGASNWQSQAGGPLGTGQAYNVGAGMQVAAASSVAYHFFDDGSDNILVVCEKTSGVFTHMGWGPSITKAGTWTGGAYFFGSSPGYNMGLTSGQGSTTNPWAPMPTDGVGGWCAGYLRADIDAWTGKWCSAAWYCNTAVTGFTGRAIQTQDGYAAGLQSNAPTIASIIGRLTSIMNSQCNLIPIRLYAGRDAGGASYLGDLPNIFYANGVGNGFAAAGIYQIGAANYMMFPNFAIQKFA